MSPLSESIRKTVAYFSLFNYPLTKEELFAFLWQPPRLGYEDFLTGLAEAERVGEVAARWGYYFFPGQDEAVENRRRRLVLSEEKMKLARRAAKKIRSTPFLRAIFVCNSVAAGLASPESDLDLFIITAPGRIWLVRFITNFWLRFLGWRVYGAKRRDRACLSFYVTDERLDLSSLRALDEDIHFAYWFCQLSPLYDPENYGVKLFEANRWVENYAPHFRCLALGGISPVKDSSGGRFWKKIWEKFWSGAYGDLLEKQAKGVQLARLRLTGRDAASRSDKNVILSDEAIKLHDNDNRKEIWERWRRV